MATGSVSTFGKNAKNFACGMASLAAKAPKMYAIYKTLKDRAWNHAPQEYKDQMEVWDVAYWKRHLSQHKNMWVDFELSTEVKREDLAEYHQFRQDLYKVNHCVGSLGVIGGWALLAWPLWWGNDTWVPSTFNANEAELAKWREAQDLYRYKYAAAMIHDCRWWHEHHRPVDPKYHRAWEELWEKSDVRRDPKLCADCHHVYKEFQPFWAPRRKQIRHIARAMGIPSFPTLGKICLQTRIRDYWELVWNEDYMVIKDKLHTTMTDAQLYDYAWRRFLAPYDKNLTRAELTQRVEDYHTFLQHIGTFMEVGQAPHIFITITYCLGYYHEPGFLEGDIAELEQDDFQHIAAFGKDAFLRRLEFENGALRDQVEAHSHKKLLERQQKLDS